MTDVAVGEPVFLSNLPAGPSERALACAVIGASTLLFVVLAPLAKIPLSRVPAFIPIYQSALLINDLITVVFLLGQAQVSRSNALRILAGGYLFTALMSTTHALTFPGLFSPAGLLGAGPQTTAWLYMFWHGGFPLFVIGYARLGKDEAPARWSRATIPVGVGLVCAAVGALALVCTAGQQLLPPLMRDTHYTPVLIIVVSAVWVLNLAAVLAVVRRRPYSVLDLWLMVTMCAWLFDIALSAMFNAGRYDLGFYAGRIYGLLAASFVLIVLLVENGKLYIQLIRLRDSDREKAAELRRLSAIDQLTGIANRRAFDEAIDQEWRRMMRHRTALSLLMIDVDYFKRFNDGYGHVAGDQCLRAVAQAIAGLARRAGEMAARYGGEEFVVLLPHTDLEAAVKLAERMIQSVRELDIPHKDSTAAPHVTISVGVASMAQLSKFVGILARGGMAVTTLPATPLIQSADHALYRAKMAGRNRVVAANDDDVRSAIAA